MMTINEFIDTTINCHDEDSVFSHFEAIMKQYGFDRLCYSLMTAHPSIQKDAGHAVLANYPGDFLNHYVKNNYSELDPVRQFVVTTYRPFLWDELDSLMRLNDINKQVMNEARDAGLLDGMAVPIYGPGREIAGVGMAGSEKIGALKSQQIYEINLICQHFHLAYSIINQRKHQVTKFTPKLSSREYDVLSWAAQGKSDSVIADILDISEGTVKTNMQRINKKLETQSRVTAICKALMLGLVTID